ncbi:uncharacterized protein UTRI_02359 [Ustilago trichophora]|uniref:Uncharacterized protein n=1 Tax=Ustilago trichophora TaxID=86804 RepID=A0A5C3E7N3_9BASI|nr:uncharacterized protein UTRI_02359 [Ustilago trichophora]
MPTITFITPPGRPSVLRGHTAQEATANDAAEATDTGSKPSTSALRQTQSAPWLDKDKESEPSPIVFQKRILPQLTTSPEPAIESFDLPRSRVSLDDARSHQSQTGESKRPSLLSTAIVGSSAQPPRSASTTNLGILRRAEVENAQSSTEGISRATADGTTEGIAPAPPRPRLHFIEPYKETVPHVSARPETSIATHTTLESTTSALTHAAVSAASGHPTQAELAPRKRSLVIQEHADVLERAAERAARQANNLSAQALEQHHTRTGAFGKSRQHSTSSAGEETASTRSSWALRSNSRGSSIGTSPTVVSEDNSEEPPELELSKPAEEQSVVPIFQSAAATEAVDAQHQSAAPPAATSRKLTFIDPAPSRRRPPPRVRPISPNRRDSDREASSSSNRKEVNAISDGEGHTTGESSRRVLAFAACPKPERAARLSPAHAARKSKTKLSASPAPHKLAYPQRLRGIRGTDPIRSPAPDRVAPLSTKVESWDEYEQEVSSEGSGYSEDEEDDDSEEEDDDDDDDDDDELGRSIQSDIQSLDESSSQQSEDNASLEANDASPPASMEEAKDADLHQSASEAREIVTEMLAGENRRPSTPALNLVATANAALVAQRSPPRLPQQSRSQQTSPRSGPSNRSARKLKPKDSFSHPMCFLPDAFEDSAPPTPTEPESDGYEPPRTNFLQGWLSEGGSAASSRRASWQQQPSPGLRGSAPIGEEGLAVPITLPPFRRTRERTAPHGVMSDGEQSSRSLAGNAAFIRESAGSGRSLNCNEGRLGKFSAGTSPYASPHPQTLGISVPADGRPSQPVMWRHLSSQHAPVSERPSTAIIGHRRASHSMEPRKVSSAFTSPIGSYSHVNGRMTPLLQASSSERPIRPSVGKQRAVSTSSHIRSRPLVAPSTHDTVVGATSPPRDDAFTHLKHHLAHSPKSHGEPQRGPRSGSTTPGWTSDGQLPSPTTSRYWTERLSSLAQAMSEELSIVGNAVLGYEPKASIATPSEEVAPHVTARELHRRSHSVPLESATLSSSGKGAVDESSSVRPSSPPQPPVAQEPFVPRRNSVGVPVPIKPKPLTVLNGGWTTERDGETHAPPSSNRRNTEAADDSSSVEDDTQPFQFAQKEVGQDGQTRLVVIHTSERGVKPVSAAGAGMQFEWAKNAAPKTDL